MTYRELVKYAGKFDNLSEEQAVDYLLTNAREMSAEDHAEMDKRLNSVHPSTIVRDNAENPYLEVLNRQFNPLIYNGVKWIDNANFESDVDALNKELGGLSIAELEDYYKKNNTSDEMTDLKRQWIQRRIGNLRRQQAARERYAATQKTKYKAKYGPSGQKEQSKIPQMVKDTESTWYEQNKDWILGTLAGGVSGAAAYGLAGLVPQLRRRRVLRALIGLGTGTAIGLGTSKIV